MKRLTLLSSLAIGALPIHAQKWATGFRTGIEQLNTNFKSHDFKGNNLLWSNQLFLAQRWSPKIETELNVSYGRTATAMDITRLEGDTGGGTIHTRTRATLFTLGLLGRYTFVQLGPMDLNLQAGFTMEYARRESSSTLYPVLVDIPQYFEDKHSTFSPFSKVMAGPGVTYALSSRMFLNGNLMLHYKINSGSHASLQYLSDWASSFHIGAGFCF